MNKWKKKWMNENEREGIALVGLLSSLWPGREEIETLRALCRCPNPDDHQKKTQFVAKGSLNKQTMASSIKYDYFD